MFLVVDPATTAGAGVSNSGGFSVTSNLAGPGSWHLYAVDDLADSYGIRSFFVKLNGTISSINNRSPMAQYNDDVSFANGSGPLSVGFNQVRETTPTIDGSQDPYNGTQVGGFGRSAGNFQLTTPGQSFPATTSGQWGNYADPFTSGSLGNTGATRNALFLAEGTYTGIAPTVDVTTPLADGGSGVNYWTDAGLTRSETALQLSSSNPFACPDCVNIRDTFLVTSKSATDPAPQPAPTVLPAPPTPPVVTPTPSGSVPSPPVATSDPQAPPVPANDPQPETQPHVELPPRIAETVYYNGNGISVSTGDSTTGVNHDGFVSFAYQPIDLAVSVIQYKVVPMSSHGLQSAMMIALAGLRAPESFAFDGSNQFSVAPSIGFASFNALGIGLADRLSIESAVAVPEPAALALFGLAAIALGGLVRRRCQIIPRRPFDTQKASGMSRGLFFAAPSGVASRYK